MEHLIILLTALYIVISRLEKKNSDKYRSKVKHVIYVNGTRGKSTVTRMIYAGLKASGIRCSSKTTGTVPIYIDPDGVEHIIKRKGHANIKEQLSILKRAIKDGCEVLVIECMAIHPHLQYISQHKMLNADIGVITNVRMDHDDVMGSTLSNIANSLSNTIPKKGYFFTTESTYFSLFERTCHRLDTTAKLVEVNRDLPDFDFKDNIAVALAVCEHCGVRRETALFGMEHFIRDPYALSVHRIGNGGLFINGLSVNDPESTKIVYNHIRSNYNLDDRKLIILINNREDRGYRTCQLIDLIVGMNPDAVWIMGDHRHYTYRKIKKMISYEAKISYFSGVQAIPLSELNGEDVVFALGNIGGNGGALLERVYKEGEICIRR